MYEKLSRVVSFAGSRFRGELKLPTLVLRFQPFISHLQWKPLYLLINSRVLDSPPHSLGQFTIWIWRKKWQSPYSSHYPQWKTARANVMASLKTLNKLLSTTFSFSPSLPLKIWMLRSIGVGCFVSPKNGNLRCKKLVGYFRICYTLLFWIFFFFGKERGKYIVTLINRSPLMSSHSPQAA